MYGDCRRKGRCRQAPQAGGVAAQAPAAGAWSVTTVNSVDERLAAVVKELDTLSPDMTKFLVPSAGTY